MDYSLRELIRPVFYYLYILCPVALFSFFVRESHTNIILIWNETERKKKPVEARDVIAQQ